MSSYSLGTIEIAIYLLKYKEKIWEAYNDNSIKMLKYLRISLIAKKKHDCMKSRSQCVVQPRTILQSLNIKLENICSLSENSYF